MYIITVLYFLFNFLIVLLLHERSIKYILLLLIYYLYYSIFIGGGHWYFKSCKLLYNSLTFLIFSITLRNIAIYAIRILYNLYDIRKSSSVIYERTIICYAILILYSFGQQRVAHGPFSSSRRIQFLYVLLSFIGSDNTNYHTSSTIIATTRI